MGKLETTLLLQVLKVLGDTLKSGAMATQQNTDNKESYESIEGELQVVFSSEENVSCLAFAIEEEV